MPLIDITGQKFHRLIVLGYAGRIKNKPHWNCVCDCGNKLQVRGDSLKVGNTKSCGCQKIDSATKHGHNRKQKPSKTYISWQSMIGRCYNPKNEHYPRYGARGITVCERWRESFAAFLADMGERPKDKTLERIDNDRNYSPENCRWATALEQSRNRSSSRRLIHNGQTKTVSEWAETLNIPRIVIQDRIRLGWNDKRIITTPYVPRFKKA